MLTARNNSAVFGSGTAVPLDTDFLNGRTWRCASVRESSCFQMSLASLCSLMRSVVARRNEVHHARTMPRRDAWLIQLGVDIMDACRADYLSYRHRLGRSEGPPRLGKQGDQATKQRTT